MRADAPSRATRILVAILIVVTAGVTTDVGGADRALVLRARANQLRSETAALADRSHSALVQLYALESELAAARARIGTLTTQAAAVRRMRTDVVRRLTVARRTHAAAQEGLARRARELYEEGDIDPLAVILGASSLDDAITRIDHVNDTAALDRRIATRAEHAARALRALSRRLAAREQRLDALREQAETATVRLQAARSERAAFISHLAEQRRLNESQIAALENRAQAAERRSAKVNATVAPPAPPPPPPAAEQAPQAAPQHPSPVSGRRMTVQATAYSLPGHTSSGLPVGPGIVAVDPSVIPMGTRMTIPGYGEGIAADTGSAIVGARIDVWFPTYEQAAAWGLKTVTITLH